MLTNSLLSPTQNNLRLLFVSKPSCVTNLCEAKNWVIEGISSFSQMWSIEINFESKFRFENIIECDYLLETYCRVNVDSLWRTMQTVCSGVEILAAADTVVLWREWCCDLGSQLLFLCERGRLHLSTSPPSPRVTQKMHILQSGKQLSSDCPMFTGRKCTSNDFLTSSIGRMPEPQARLRVVWLGQNWLQLCYFPPTTGKITCLLLVEPRPIILASDHLPWLLSD